MDIEKSFSKGDLSLNFLVSRSSSEIRKGYIDKLLANGVLKLEPSKKYQSSTCRTHRSNNLRLGRYPAVHKLSQWHAVPGTQPRSQELSAQPG